MSAQDLAEARIAQIRKTLETYQAGERWTVRDFIGATLCSHNRSSPRESDDTAARIIDRVAREILHDLLPLIE